MGGYPLFLGKYGRTRVARHRPGGHAGRWSSDRRPRWRVDSKMVRAGTRAGAERPAERRPATHHRQYAPGSPSGNNFTAVRGRNLAASGAELPAARGVTGTAIKPNDTNIRLARSKGTRPEPPARSASKGRPCWHCGLVARRVGRSTANKGRTRCDQTIIRRHRDGSGRYGWDRHGPGRSATTGRAIANGGGLVARTPRGGEDRTCEGHDRQLSLQHVSILHRNSAAAGGFHRG